MIRLSDEELQDYGEPDFCIYNAGKCEVCSGCITCNVQIFPIQFAVPFHWRKQHSPICCS